MQSRECNELSQHGDIASRREFALYWVGFLTLIIGSVSVLMTISGLLVDVVSYRCWYPIISPLLGVREPPVSTYDMPVYCGDPVVAVVRFIFNFLASLVVVGAGVYTMLNGKRR